MPVDFFKVLKNRHSYRGAFRNVPVARDDLVSIVKAGLSAPSGKNEQTTLFIIVDDPKLVGEIGRMHPVNKAMRQAGAMIACIVDKQPAAIYEGHSFQVEDCAAAVENMLLAVTALGYASVWIDGWLRVAGRAEKIDQLLGIPDEKTIRVLLPVGVPAEPVSPIGKKPFESRVWFNRFDLKRAQS